LKIRSTFGHSQVHSYLLVQVLYSFLNMYRILNPYKKSSNEMVLKGAFESSYRFKIMVHDSIWKVHYYMFGVYLLNFVIMYIYLFELTILIIIFITTLMILPYICGIQIKYILQKVQCDAKSGPPYLATTPSFCFLTYNKKSQRLNIRNLQYNSCKSTINKKTSISWMFSMH
jgi:hypothetical protein